MRASSKMELFDAAIKTGSEDEAIVYGTELFAAENMLYLIDGFNELADKGSKRCAVIAARLTVQFSKSSICDGVNIEICKTAMEHLDTAIGYLERIDCKGIDELRLIDIMQSERKRTCALASKDKVRPAGDRIKYG